LSDLGKELYPKRKTTIERCFAITKFNHNLGFTFLRGLKKNKDRNFKMYPVEWTLNKKVFYSLGFLMR
ncbi:MAG: hypothetical protein PUG55_04175, partial [Bacillales bacterium]|nr:hypothetical protein [Bacillales bacterium]